MSTKQIKWETYRFFYGKDMMTETLRKDDNPRRRMRSEKAHESGCRTIKLSTPMGLSFEYTIAVGSRASENKQLNGRGSSLPHSLDLKPY